MIDFKKQEKFYRRAHQSETRELADQFVVMIRERSSDLNGFKFEIGCMLIDFFKSKSYSAYCHDIEIVKECGYMIDRNSVSNVFFAVCEVQFGFDKGQVSRLMNVVDEFGADDRAEGIREKYRVYKWSVLEEMLPMSEEERELVTPDMTVRMVRELKKKIKNELKKKIKKEKKVATSQQEDEGPEDLPVTEEPERFKKYTRLQLIEYIVKLESDLKRRSALSKNKGKKG